MFYCLSQQISLHFKGSMYGSSNHEITQGQALLINSCVESPVHGKLRERENAVNVIIWYLHYALISYYGSTPFLKTTFQHRCAGLCHRQEQVRVCIPTCHRAPPSHICMCVYVCGRV